MWSTTFKAKPERRQFSAEYKRRILEEADACTEAGQIGALLRREGLYSSPGKGMALLPSPSPKNRACCRVGRQRVTFSALFQRPPSERCVTLSMSHRSPVDATHSESGIHASRTLPLFKQHQPAALPHVVGSPNLKVLRRLRHHRALAP